jgi:biotin carboxylase
VNRYVVVVDPLSTGQDYAPAFLGAGLTPVAVLSAEPTEAMRPSWHPERFDHVHRFDGDLHRLAATLRGYRPEALVPGAECGVPLYDALVPLVLPGTGNVAELSAARYDKGAMGAAVAAAGVPHLRQICSDDPDLVEKWLAETRLLDTAVVLKPANSAGTDEVRLVGPGADWGSLVSALTGRVNLAGRVTDAVVVQEYARGVEYLVDSYSVDGRHGLVDVCRYTKYGRDGRIGIYDRVDFLPPDDPVVQTLWDYVRRVLDAVGIRNGCGHAEVMLTDAGPRLVEIGARPAGGGHQLICELATGDNQIARTVDHRAHGRFRSGYRLQRFVRGVFISAPRAGVWRNAEVFDDVDGLPTYYAKHFPHGTGDAVPATEDLATFLAWVILTGQDQEAIEEDYRRIRDWERQIVIG